MRVLRMMFMNGMKCLVEQDRIERMRAKAGAWVLDLRCAAEVTSAELAEQVGIDADEMTAIETGRCAVPAALYQEFAQIFNVDLQGFAKTCLMYDSPSAYEALFGDLPEALRAAA